MNERTPDAERRNNDGRARSGEEPGAHSGSERRAQERVVPGKASAREGYQRTGTLDGGPLTGVEAASDTEVGADRAGRLSAPDEGLRTDTTKEPVARDEGIDGGGASAEEAAVHIIGDEEAAPGV